VVAALLLTDRLR